MSLPIRIIFPKMGYERIRLDLLRPSTFASLYLVSFFYCFVAQAAFCYRDGVFFADASTERLEFLEDYYNLFNYTIVVPAYVMAGAGLLVSLFAMDKRMTETSSGLGFEVRNESKPYVSGVLSIALLVFIILVTQAQYAFSVQTEATVFFWFHGTNIDSAFPLRGHFYLMVNAVLSAYVAGIAILHLELFRWASELSRSLREHAGRRADAADSLWVNDNKIKELFVPFTETALWSKAFAVALAVNLYTWKQSGVNSDVATGTNALYVNTIFVIYTAIVVWVVALPRYRVQYEIYRVRKSLGVHQYSDIRMPWVLGWSGLIDFLLLAFLSNAIFGNDFAEFLKTMFL